MHYEVYRLTALDNDKIQLCKLTGRDSTCICISENSIEQCDYTETDAMIHVLVKTMIVMIFYNFRGFLRIGIRSRVYTYVNTVTCFVDTSSIDIDQNRLLIELRYGIQQRLAIKYPTH